MRKKNQEITDRKILEVILSKGTICRLAMSEGNESYLLPFNYGYRDNTLYIHCAREGKKLDILRKNSRVCFEIEDHEELITGEKACDWATHYRSVVGYGEVEIMSNYSEKEKGLHIIMVHNGMTGDISFGRKAVDACVLLKISIESISGKQSGSWDKTISGNRIEIETDRLTLREVCIDDLEDIHRIHSTPEVDEFNTLGIPGSIIETETLLRSMIAEQSKARRKSYTWKIMLKGSDTSRGTETRKGTEKIIGIAGLTLSLDRFRLGEIYYNLLPEYWGKGYATETAKAMIKSGFEDFKLHKVEAGVATENERSIRVLEKAGMTREGLRRKILPIRGEWKDNYHYAIVETPEFSNPEHHAGRDDREDAD